jgi:hypothetical protein
MYAQKSLKIVGFQGEYVPNTFFQQEVHKNSLGIIFPGFRYSCSMPLLYYTTEQLLSSQYDVLQVEYAYSQRKDFSSMDPQQRNQIIRSDAIAAFKAGRQQGLYKNILIVGKSIGTIAMGHLLSHEHLGKDTKFIWLTPLLANESLRRQIRLQRPQSLFIAGTGDQHYHAQHFADMVSLTNAKSLLVEEANHSLAFIDNIEKSIVTLGKVIKAISSFIDET